MTEDTGLLLDRPISDAQRRKQFAHFVGVLTAGTEWLGADIAAYANAVRHDIRRKELLDALREGRGLIDALIAAMTQKG